ncbi:hypothetical protein J6590_035247, partial [Homalodisca vitripennis]
QECEEMEEGRVRYVVHTVGYKAATRTVNNKLPHLNEERIVGQLALNDTRTYDGTPPPLLPRCRYHFIHIRNNYRLCRYYVINIRSKLQVLSLSRAVVITSSTFIVNYRHCRYHVIHIRSKLQALSLSRAVDITSSILINCRHCRYHVIHIRSKLQALPLSRHPYSCCRYHVIHIRKLQVLPLSRTVDITSSIFVVNCRCCRYHVIHTCKLQVLSISRAVDITSSILINCRHCRYHVIHIRSKLQALPLSRAVDITSSILINCRHCRYHVIHIRSKLQALPLSRHPYLAGWNEVATSRRLEVYLGDSQAVIITWKDKTRTSQRLQWSAHEIKRDNKLLSAIQVGTAIVDLQSTRQYSVWVGE